MKKSKIKVFRRKRRKKRSRKKMMGTENKPRITVFKSSKHIYAQVVDDIAGHTLVQENTRKKELAEGLKNTGNVEAAKKVGEYLGKQLKDKGIEEVCFDKGGFKYHGRVKALADAVRAQGVKF